jgi:hypothetical protein
VSSISAGARGIRPKHSPDEVRQKALRVYMRDVFVNYADELEELSEARH